jgi:glycosyltransferase involved in cell wall biosynthesis
MPSKAERAAIFARCGALVVPNLSECKGPFITEAMAAGLVILGSRRSAQVRSLVTGNLTGWTFDPLDAQSIAATLANLFAATPAMLDTMREAARARISALQTEWVDDAVSRPLHFRPAHLMATNSPIKV